MPPKYCSEFPSWSGCGCLFLLFSAKQRQLEAAKIILCAFTYLPSSKTRVTGAKSFLLLVQKCIYPENSREFTGKFHSHFRERECKWKIPFPISGTGMRVENSLPKFRDGNWGPVFPGMIGNGNSRSPLFCRGIWPLLNAKPAHYFLPFCRFLGRCDNRSKMAREILFSFQFKISSGCSSISWDGGSLEIL